MRIQRSEEARLQRKGTLLGARLPSLDGWRALSILMVLGAHSTGTAGFPDSMKTLFKWASDGELGVRTFFIISGLLITWLMEVETDRTGRVSLQHFYIRRALRILPVYFTFLLVLAALQVLTPFHQSTAAWIGNLTFTTNFVPEGSWTSAHLWSLAVEEQFYLLWPLLFLFISVANSKRPWAWILACPICISPVVRVISYLKVLPLSANPLFVGTSFFKFCDSLAIGCACAILLARKRDEIQGLLAAWPRAVTGIALLLVGIPYVLVRWLLLGIVTVPFGPTLQGVGIALLLMQSIMNPQLGLYSVFNNRIVCQIGVLSYSLYIWQQVFCTKPAVLGVGPVWWLSFPTWLIAVFAAAFASYYGLERPMFRLRARFRE